MTRPESPPAPPSELFANLVCSAGTRTATCDFCGRFHWARTHLADLTPTEIDDLGAKLTAKPDKYQEHADDSVATGYLDGKLFVWGCACNGIRRYEDFLWKNKDIVIDYLKARAEDELRQARTTAEDVSGLPETTTRKGPRHG